MLVPFLGVGVGSQDVAAYCEDVRVPFKNVRVPFNDKGCPSGCGVPFNPSYDSLLISNPSYDSGG